MSRQTLPSETEERILPSTNERKNVTISLLNQQALNGTKTNCFSNPFSPLQESPTQPPGNSKLDESKENPPHHTVPLIDNTNARSKRFSYVIRMESFWTQNKCFHLNRKSPKSELHSSNMQGITCKMRFALLPK